MAELTPHDAIYHRLFSYPEMVADLLRNFLDPALAAELDLSRMTRLNTKLTAQTGERRRGDMVWEVPIRAGGNLFLLLMLEFQSDMDPWMVLRLAVYTGLLYQQLVAERKLKPADGLPPVLPVILYNGEPRWSAATALHDLIRLPSGSPLWPYQPQMRYHVIDEGVFPDEELQGRSSLLAIFFRMQHPATPEAILGASRDLIQWFANHPDGPPVKRLFRELLIAGLEKLEGHQPASPIPEGLEEVMNMLANHVEKWTKDIEQRGILIGKEEGILIGELKGLQRGKVDTLLLLIERRFGPAPGWVHARLADADLETLDMWMANILDAESVEAVFQ
ncbi:MAG: Rpn family recombination-promoting nuclease/putative transposase [Magnetococcales bacterium]|nr:Rpn family recombination-promoting nuclease/putative transposase [Magnetococcales bacterium]